MARKNIGCLRLGSSISQNVIPVIVGFTFGSLISVFLLPNSADIFQSDCVTNGNAINDDFVKNRDFESMKIDSTSQVSPAITTIVQTEKSSISPASTKNVQKINRPRFSATELGIKDKLFVGVITSQENLPTLASAINKTVAHHVSKLIFFIDAPSTISSSTTTSPRNLNLVHIGETPDNLKPLAILNYFAGRGRSLANNYDWFFFMPDTVYLKAFKLFELVSHMSFGYNVQMGRPLMKNTTIRDSVKSMSSYCDFNAGVLISFGLMRSMLANLRQCMQDADPMLTASENLGRCILHADSTAVCSEEWNAKVYRSWPLSTAVDITTDLSKLRIHDSFNSALAVFPVHSVSDIFYLHKHYCNHEVDQINQLTSTMEQNLLISALSNEDETDDFSWPPGIPAHSKQRSRYELLKWDYFTETDIFENNNDRNSRPLDGIDAKDVKEVMGYAANFLSTKYPGLKFQRLLSGYRRFDPYRGMDYMLDMSLIKEDENREIVQRINLLRPLNKVELIPVPYVTEATTVFVVVPVSPNDMEASSIFLDHFSRNCLDSDENAKLIFVLFYETVSEQMAYAKLIGEIEAVRKKYGFDDSKSGSRKSGGLDYVQIRSSIPSPFLLMDLMLQTNGVDRMYLIVTPWTEIYGDFLNRVRMNTIKEFQIFFPIPFVQYNPKIIYRRKLESVGTTTDHIDIHKNVGRFDKHDFGIVSFYGSDYYARRASYAYDDADGLYLNHDLLSIFLNSTLHIFRAVEPALKIRYHEIFCDIRSTQDIYQRCSLSKCESLGTKPQLANLLFEYGALND